MKICHATTFWPNRFGHTHYTDALIRGMRVHDPSQHALAAEHPSAPCDTAEFLCVPCFRRDEDYVDSITRAAKDAGTDVLLLQYSNDLFGEDTRFPRLIERLEGEGIRTVVNLHSVYPPHWRVPYRPGGRVADFDRAVGRHATCLNVHTRRMRQDLLQRGIDPSKVSVIPHGSPVHQPLDQAESLRALGIPEDTRLVLFFGFIWLGKGLSFLLDVFARVARRVPGAGLYVGGYTRKRTFYGDAYMAWLHGKMRVLGIAPRTWSTGDYVPDEMMATLFSASELVAFPYRQDYSSVSGVLHHAAGYGRLVLCSRISKFHEVEEGISRDLVVEQGDRRGWADAMTGLLTDRALAEAMREKVREFARRTSWPEVGRMHLALYEGLLAGRSPAGVQEKHFPLEGF
jgi:glycosyltransferase involved in cell wall biosynthesis